MYYVQFNNLPSLYCSLISCLISCITLGLLDDSNKLNKSSTEEEMFAKFWQSFETEFECPIMVGLSVIFLCVLDTLHDFHF